MWAYTMRSSMLSHQLCILQYPPRQQPEEFGLCIDSLGEQLYNAFNISNDARGRYVFARLAEREFAKDIRFSFAYSPLPPPDRDIQIIHEALAKALDAGEHLDENEENVFFTEDAFFEHLKAEGFVPTKTAGGEESLLAQIMNDPQQWPTELTRRMTARLVYLERQAADIYATREPDPDKRESSYTALMGGNRPSHANRYLQVPLVYFFALHRAGGTGYGVTSYLMSLVGIWSKGTFSLYGSPPWRCRTTTSWIYASPSDTRADCFARAPTETGRTTSGWGWDISGVRAPA